MNRWLRSFCFLLILAFIPGILAAAELLPIDKKELVQKKYSGWNGVLRVWLTQEESGLAPWINACASEFEKQHNGVYVQVSVCSDLTAMNAKGVRAPEIVMFLPGQGLDYDRLAELPPMNVRTSLQMTNIAVPVAMSGYAWAINTDMLNSVPRDCPALALPIDTATASYSAALLAMSSVASYEESRPAPGMDLGLTGENTPAPACEYVPIRLSADLTASTDAFRLFQNGELPACIVGPSGIARLESLSAQGRGPGWRLEVPGDAVFTDRILLAAAVDSDDEREALSIEFIAYLLSDSCQRTLSRRDRLPVTDAPADLSAAEPLSVIDAALRDLYLYVPPAFFDEWRVEAPGALRRFLRGEAPSAVLLDELFG